MVRCATPQVVLGLQPHPRLRSHAKVFPQPKRRVSGDATLAIDDAADPPRGHGQVASEPVDADVHRLHEILEKDFARVDGVQQFGICVHSGGLAHRGGCGFKWTVVFDMQSTSFARR